MLAKRRLAAALLILAGLCLVGAVGLADYGIYAVTVAAGVGPIQAVGITFTMLAVVVALVIRGLRRPGALAQ